MLRFFLNQIRRVLDAVVIEESVLAPTPTSSARGRQPAGIVYAGSPEFPGQSDMFAVVAQSAGSSTPLVLGQFRVLFQNSYWPAAFCSDGLFNAPDAPPLPGTRVRVIGRRNITLIVELITRGGNSSSRPYNEGAKATPLKP